jgi:transcriptional regulator GlxA family with amidase domain
MQSARAAFLRPAPKESIGAARMLLERSDWPLKSVAYDCGFGTADRMRVVFSERLGVTPAHYRANFRRSEPRGSG